MKTSLYPNLSYIIFSPQKFVKFVKTLRIHGLAKNLERWPKQEPDHLDEVQDPHHKTFKCHSEWGNPISHSPNNRGKPICINKKNQKHRPLSRDHWPNCLEPRGGPKNTKRSIRTNRVLPSPGQDFPMVLRVTYQKIARDEGGSVCGLITFEKLPLQFRKSFQWEMEKYKMCIWMFSKCLGLFRHGEHCDVES